MDLIISEANLTDEKREMEDAGRGYSVAETILVPPCYKKLQPRESYLTTISNRTRRLASKLSTTDPKEIVKTYWQGSFSQSRKTRMLTRTRSRIRRSILLAEELRKLEKEDVLWKEEYADPAGSYRKVTVEPPIKDPPRKGQPP